MTNYLSNPLELEQWCSTFSSAVDIINAFKNKLIYADLTIMNHYFPLGPNAIQETFPEIDFSGATTDTITLADGSNANNKLYAKNMSFAGIIYKNIQMVGDNFTRETMLDLFEHLADYSDGDAHTVLLGSVSLARLSDEDKAIAINKNWTLS